MSNSINVNDAYKMIKNGDAVLIDVRSSDEFKKEHIVYAMSLPMDVAENELNKLAIPKDKTILIHCLKGVRSEMFCNKIDGTDCVHNISSIAGGIEAWKEEGLPVVSVNNVNSTDKSMMSIFRQTQIIIGAFVALSVLFGYLGIEQGFVVAGLIGIAFTISGITGWCGIGNMLLRMPWNK